eukprot:CAMPEP_0175256812 /NCGR_PEP_ID=MMETSP0093-20121207/38400_1 /TAXON_ID=311494 /ORGANISM="Alexandrium monilatum, Strain CCMP3105" /LENGTH=37 /DNA_ID= /DNA_START= /DNA_END= /DNA_ORIENTATION=
MACKYASTCDSAESNVERGRSTYSNVDEKAASEAQWR